MPRPLFFIGMLGCGAILSAADVTVVLQFDGPQQERSVEQMKRETEQIVKDAGLRLEWRARDEVGREVFPNLVVVRFKGKCVLEPVPALYDERGPFAFTYNADGQVLPFSEVDCNHVRASVQSAMGGDDFGRPDYLMGRALGRVVAHELVHILARTGSHGREGVAQPAFSGKDLIGPPLRLSRDDVDRLRRGLTGK
jgi:hypothetical protein